MEHLHKEDAMVTCDNFPPENELPGFAETVETYKAQLTNLGYEKNGTWKNPNEWMNEWMNEWKTLLLCQDNLGEGKKPYTNKGESKIIN